MNGEPFPAVAVMGIGASPGPPTESGPAIVLEGLKELVVGVHHERAPLRYRFSQRPALQQNNFGPAGTGPKLERLTGINHGSRPGLKLDGLADGQRGAAVEVENPPSF